MEFKVGDRVKVINLRDYYSLEVSYSEEYLNETGTIVDTKGKHYPYRIVFDNNEKIKFNLYYWHSSNLKLVENHNSLSQYSTEDMMNEIGKRVIKTVNEKMLTYSDDELDDFEKYLKERKAILKILNDEIGNTYSINEIIKANEYYKEEKKKLNSLRFKIMEISENIDLNEVETTLNYAQTKDLYQMLLYEISNSKIDKLKQIMQDKKVKEYPQINDVHYYPEINNIDFLTKDEKIVLDKALKEAYKTAKRSKLYKDTNPKVTEFLINNFIIEKVYIFHCNCGSNECYDKEITQSYFDKLKDYWIKYKNGLTTEEEDNEMSWGWFETGCWNDGDVEISCLADFEKHLKYVEYKVVKEPDMILDNI